MEEAETEKEDSVSINKIFAKTIDEHSNVYVKHPDYITETGKIIPTENYEKVAFFNKIIGEL